MTTVKHPYGYGFASEVSKRRARELSAGFNLPRAGFGVCIREAPDGFGGFYRLSVENISGTLFLASHNVERPRWLDLFNVEGITK